MIMITCMSSTKWRCNRGLDMKQVRTLEKKRSNDTSGTSQAAGEAGRRYLAHGRRRKRTRMTARDAGGAGVDHHEYKHHHASWTASLMRRERRKKKKKNKTTSRCHYLFHFSPRHMCIVCPLS